MLHRMTAFMLIFAALWAARLFANFTPASAFGGEVFVQKMM